MPQRRKKDIAVILTKARRQGCTVTGGSSRHWKVHCPDGSLIVVSCSPSDPRALHHIRSHFKKAGIQV